MYPSGVGMATILAELPAPDAQTIWLALDTLARSGDGTTTAAVGVPDRLGIDARRADALTRLCAGALADPGLPRRHGRPANIHVVVDLPTLLGLADHPGELLGYGPIPASVARSLAADGCWQRLVVEPVTGHLLDAGTTRYRPNQELTDYVLTRSPVCDFPTCHTPAPACDIDHINPYNPDHPDSGGPPAPATADPAADDTTASRPTAAGRSRPTPTDPPPGPTPPAAPTTHPPPTTDPADPSHACVGGAATTPAPRALAAD